MNLVELFNRSRSGVVQILHIHGEIVLGYGSGFFIGGKLITNHHVAAAALLPANADDSLGIRFHDDPPNKPRYILKCREFAGRVCGSSEEHSFDYVIANVPEAAAGVPYQFSFAPDGGPSVGQFVAFQGYPFGQPNLVSHAGYVSSIHPSGVATMIQLDATVNSGNSGGPLFDTETGLVLGVISRKQTGLSDMFDELGKSFEENVRMLSAIQGGVTISGVSVTQTLALTQSQLGRVAQEIKRSANVGIGFAVKATALRWEAALS